MHDRIISMKELLIRVPLSRTQIWRMEKAGIFPRRIKIGARRIGYSENAIARWIEYRDSLSEQPIFQMESARPFRGPRI